MEVEEAGSAEALLAGGGGGSGSSGASGSGSAAVPPGGARAVYVLTAAICHVRDEDEIEEPAGGQGERGGGGGGGAAGAAGAAPGQSDYEGHLVAHIRVPLSYLQQTDGSAPPSPARAAGAGEPTMLGGSAPSTPQRAPMPQPPASPRDIASLLLPSVGPGSPQLPLPAGAGGAQVPPLSLPPPAAAEAVAVKQAQTVAPAAAGGAAGAATDGAGGEGQAGLLSARGEGANDQALEFLPQDSAPGDAQPRWVMGGRRLGAGSLCFAF